MPITGIFRKSNTISRIEKQGKAECKRFDGLIRNKALVKASRWVDKNKEWKSYYQLN
jgi:hypothetical protein